MVIHCLQSGLIAKYSPLGYLHSLALEIALGQYLGPQDADCLRGRIFQYTPPLVSVLLHVILSYTVKKNVNTLPRVGKNWKICPPSALESALGLRPQAIFQGCKLPLGAYFPIHPSFRQCINPVLISRKNSLAAHQALIQVLCTGIRSTTFSGVRCGIKFFTFLLICHVQKPSQKVRGAVPYQFCSFCLRKETFFWMTSL